LLLLAAVLLSTSAPKLSFRDVVALSERDDRCAVP